MGYPHPCILYVNCAIKAISFKYSHSCHDFSRNNNCICIFMIFYFIFQSCVMSVCYIHGHVEYCSWTFFSGVNVLPLVHQTASRVKPGFAAPLSLKYSCTLCSGSVPVNTLLLSVNQLVSIIYIINLSDSLVKVG